MRVSSFRWKIAQFVERAWWKHYLKNKTTQDYLKWKSDYWINFYTPLSKFLEINESSTILDAGCGPAGIFMILANNSTVAIDPLLDNYEKDLHHFNRKMYQQVQFITTSIELYNNPSNFDVIFCINAINHVKNLQLALNNLVINSKKKGKIVISIDAHNYKFLKNIFSVIPGDILHPHQYTLEDYQQMITLEGTKILTTIRLKKELIFDYYVIVAEKI